MARTKITEVMMDDKTIDASKEIAMVFSIANTLRGPYKPDKYKDVIIPMIILRRLECALAPKKKAVVDAFKKNPAAPAQLLCKKSGYQFYNTCEFDLKKLLTEAPAIVENLTFYIESFSPNVQAIFEELKFKEEIKNLDKNNRLLGVVKKFSELELDPEKVDNVKMGYMFEEIIRRFLKMRLRAITTPLVKLSASSPAFCLLKVAVIFSPKAEKSPYWTWPAVLAVCFLPHTISSCV